MNIFRSRSIEVMVWALLWLWISHVAESATPYRVKGSYEYSTVTSAGLSNRVFFKNFEATVGNCQWTIRAIDPFITSSIPIIEYSFDGETMVETRMVFGDRFPKFDGSPASLTVTNYSNILPYNVPHADYYMSTLWFTFASTCYRATSLTNRICDFLDPIKSRFSAWKDAGYELSYTSQNWAPNKIFVGYAELHNQGFAMKSSAGGLFRTPLPAPYEMGFLRAIVTTSGELAEDGFSVPRETLFKLFGRTSKTAGTNSRHKATIKIIATELTLMTGNDLVARYGLARIPSDTLVSDMRINVGQVPVSYTTTNRGGWNTNTVEFSNQIHQAKYLSGKLERVDKPPSLPRVRGLVFLSIASITVTIVILGTILFAKKVNINRPQT